MEGKRFGIVVFPKRQRQRLSFHAPAACDRIGRAFRRHHPIFRCAVTVKDEVLVFRASENYRRFPPVTDQLLFVIRRNVGWFLESNHTRSVGYGRNQPEREDGALQEREA